MKINIVLGIGAKMLSFFFVPGFCSLPEASSCHIFFLLLFMLSISRFPKKIIDIPVYVIFNNSPLFSQVTVHLFFGLFILGFALAMLVIGVKTHSECPVEPMVPGYLIGESE